MTSKIYDMRDTWVDSATSYTSIKMNAFDISSDVNSKLMELKRNGLSQFTIDKFGEMVFGTLDIPRVNNLEESITNLTSAALNNKVDFIAANLAILQANTSANVNSIGLVYSDSVLARNDWYYKANATSWVSTGLLPALAQQLTPRKQVERTFYVAMNGSDVDANTYINQVSNTGMSIYKPFQTIPAALQAAAATQAACVIIVAPGEYEVPPNTEIPRNCCLYGYDVRVTKISLADGYEVTGANMFLLNSGCKVRGFTFTNLHHEQSWLNTYQGSFDSGPPKRGYAFAFKPGAYITRSPYVSDCTVIHKLTYEQMSAPIERATGNPLVPMSGGCLYADGSVLDPDSPLRSAVVDSFTAVNPNGVAYAIVTSAVVQLVSIFSNWSRVGIWSHAGGQATIVNSNASFGDYAFASTGFRTTIRLQPIDPSLFINANKAPNFGNYIKTNVDTIVNFLMTDVNGYRSITTPAFEAVILANTALANLTSRDTKTILLETADDLISGQDRGTRFWIQSQFVSNTANAIAAISTYAFNANLLPYFTSSISKIRTHLMSLTPGVTSPGTSANAIVNSALSFAVTVLNNPNNYIEVFTSKIEAASHQFSYAGSGVNYNALPFGQRATGVATDPTTNLYTSNGGVVYATFNTEAGDTYLGPDLKVDFERSTIEGQAFSRGVQNITLPLIIGVGG